MLKNKTDNLDTMAISNEILAFGKEYEDKLTLTTDQIQELYNMALKNKKNGKKLTNNLSPNLRKAVDSDQSLSEQVHKLTGDIAYFVFNNKIKGK